MTALVPGLVFADSVVHLIGHEAQRPLEPHPRTGARAWQEDGTRKARAAQLDGAYLLKTIAGI